MRRNSLPGGRARPRHLDQHGIPRLEALEGGEVFLNPELAQGFGIGSTLGLAGFSNGEAQKGGAPYPRLRAQRYFFRQTFGLGGEQETVEDGPNQFGGKRDIDRITDVGRLAVGDIFDANTYAHDPRADFSNWAILGLGGLRLPGRSAGLHPRRRSSSTGTWSCAAAVPGAGAAEQRRAGVQDRRRGGRIRAALGAR